MCLPGGGEGGRQGQYSTNCNLDGEAGALAMVWLQGVRVETAQGSRWMQGEIF
jgi:hypothetical protein